MFLNFDNLKFRNFLSYGNKNTEITFENGLILISAPNGQGKSSIIDALSFCLYGKAYRDIKLLSLINRRNKKDLYTECNFRINSDKYTIIRTLKPDSLSVKKNDKELESLSSKLLVQDEIVKILQIDYKLFKNIISLAVNNNRPFLTLSLQEKRDIIENIFNLRIFSVMGKNLKSKITKLKTEIEINQNSIDILKENIKEQQTNIAILKKNEKEFIENKLKDIQKLTENIEEKTILKNKLEEEIKICRIDEEIVKNVNITKKEMEDLNKTIFGLMAEKITIENDIKLKQIYMGNLVNVNAEINDNKANYRLTMSEFDSFKHRMNGYVETDNDVDIISKEIDEILQKKDNFQNDIDIKMLNIQKTITENDVNVKNCEQELELLKNDICPTCKREMSVNYKKMKEKEINDRIKKYDNLENQTVLNTLLKNKEEDNENISKKITELKDKKIELSKRLKEKNDLSRDFVRFEGDLKLLKNKEKNLEEKKQETEEKLNHIANVQENNIINIDKRILEITEIVKDKEKIVKEYESNLINFENKCEKKEYISKEIDNSVKNIEEIKNRTFNINILEIEEKYNVDCKKFLTLFDNQKINNDKLKIYNMTVDILSDSGIKSYFYKNLIPILNQRINEYLQKFDLSSTLIFNELMEEKITSFDSYGENVDYYSYSGGERTRIDASIWFAFIDIVKMIANFGCNLLLIDELLDSQLDNEGLDKMIESLKKMCDDSKNLSCWVISHKIQSDEMFANVYKIEKNNGFSNITF